MNRRAAQHEQAPDRQRQRRRHHRILAERPAPPGRVEPALEQFGARHQPPEPFLEPAAAALGGDAAKLRLDLFMRDMPSRPSLELGGGPFIGRAGGVGGGDELPPDVPLDDVESRDNSGVRGAEVGTVLIDCIENARLSPPTSLLPFFLSKAGGPATAAAAEAFEDTLLCAGVGAGAGAAVGTGCRGAETALLGGVGVFARSPKLLDGRCCAGLGFDVFELVDCVRIRPGNGCVSLGVLADDPEPVESLLKRAAYASM